MYIFKIKRNQIWIFIKQMLKDRTLICILCSICPTIYVNKHHYRVTYGRAPTKGSNLVLTRNRRLSGLCDLIHFFNHCYVWNNILILTITIVARFWNFEGPYFQKTPKVQKLEIEWIDFQYEKLFLRSSYYRVKSTSMF